MIPTCHEDADILVLDKPAGLAVQPGAGVTTSLVDVVERDFGFHPFLVHRLDKETAGLIIVAKDSRAAARWSEAIASRAVVKRYRAIVAGRLGDEGRLTDPVPVRGEAVEADTAFRSLATVSAPLEGRPSGQALSHVELTLGTGRTHQIRLHLAQAGAPIIGDDRHGDFPLNKVLRRAYGVRRLFLLAWGLELPGGTHLRASLPDHFRDLFLRLPGLAVEAP